MLASGAAPLLEVLHLGRNRVGDAGALALAEALRGGAAPALQRLLLFDNREIGADGAAAVLAAVRSGALPALTWASLSGNRPAADFKAVEAAVEQQQKAREAAGLGQQG